MKYLIVAADDFGLSKSINEGIIKAYKDGIVTSLNFMPASKAFDDALSLARAIKLEEAGAHLVLTETAPIADLHSVPTLVTKDGSFYKSYFQFFLNLFSNRIKQEHIYLELKTQLDRVKDAGIKITNLSGHEHIQMMPQILGIFIKLAKEYDIPSIRYPHGERLILPFGLKKIYRKLVLSCLQKHAREILNRSGLIYTDNFLGFLDSGNLREEAIIDMLASLKEGVTELVCHPGYLSPEVVDRYIFYLDCESELAAFTSRNVRNLIEEKQIKLITYGEFISKIK